jgi:phage tail-like protein
MTVMTGAAAAAVTAAERRPQPRRPRTPDPAFAARFTLSLDGEEVGSFSEVGGLAVTIEVEELVEGGQNGFTYRLPRGMKWSNVVLKRGVTKSDTLLPWLAEYSGPELEKLAGKGFRLPTRTATITVHDAKGDPVRAWSLEDAYPVRWTGPRFVASARDAATEELEVCHRGLYPAT